MFNNLIEPGAGADTIAGGLGNNEISGTVADLNSDAVTDFHAGDWFDLTDMSSVGATPEYDAASGLLTIVSGAQTAAIQLPSMLSGPFSAVSDGAGGTLVELACYVVGTRIAVPGQSEGAAVEALAIGDLVQTASGAARPIKWIGRRSYAGRFAAANPQVHPIRFRAGSLGAGLPHRDLLVSPKHAMFLDGVLIPADRLVNGVSVVKDSAFDVVHYVHIELDTHDVIWAEGVASESFVDDNSRGLFQNAHEFAALYPQQQHVPAVYCARRVEDGELLAAIKRKIDLRAGLLLPGAGEPLRGQVNGWQGSALRGWAQNPDRPEVPVCLEVLVGGKVAARTLANQFRQDLRAAGLGSGCHGFRVDLPAGAEQQTVEVRRIVDGAVLVTLPGKASRRKAA